ncbi:MAG: helix-turn-helix transcriptional regulator [Ruminiclostridium sp.]|jgi:hypothetical protein|nr:helix-turn-helix transcriptional regulator [Ruminiclostridium sp.]
MNFLEKLNYMMEKNHLNKSTLAKASGIPYTTIDGWYKRGYGGLQLTSLRKLAEYFDTTLDFWAWEDDGPARDGPYALVATDTFQELKPDYQEFILEQVDRLREIQDKEERT